MIRSEDFMASQLIRMYEPLIVNALKKCGVFYSHRYFEDIRQIAALTLWQSYEDFNGDFSKEKDIYRFSGYAYQKMCWRVIDELRRLNKFREQAMADEKLSLICENVSGDQPFNQLSQDQAIHQPIEDRLQVEQLCALAPSGGRKFIIGVYDYEMNPTQMAKHYQVSRKTIYEWRKQAQAAYQELNRNEGK